MKTVIRNSYTPQLGDYCNKIVVDKETNTIYFFDTDGVFTEVDNTRVDVEAIIAEAVAESKEYTADVADTKVDKIPGKGLSSNDFTDSEKTKLSTIAEGAQVNVIEIVKRNGSALTVTDKSVDVSVPTKTSELQNDSGYILNTVDDLVNYYTKSQTDSAIAVETTAREGADQNLQGQIDAIAASSDVVDIVGTYAELQAYDTSKLHNNDIIKVLSDETRSGATTYYRWSTTAEDFTYIGSQGPFYTKSESDSTFVPQTRTVNGKALSSDITLDATDVGALPNSTVIPTVNDATLTIQKNGTTVTTFTANSATNTTANIAVPTKTSDLTNDGADGTDTYVEAGDLAAVATSGAYADLTGKPSIPTKTSDLTNDSDFVSDASYVHTDNNFTTTLKNKLDGIAAGAEVNVQSDWAQSDNTADDYIKNKPSIPTKTSDLTNDSGFITSAALPTKLSDLTNDAGFITKSVSDLTNYYDQTTINSMFSALSVPTKTSDLTNDSGFITNTDYASASTGGVVKVGSGLSIDANGVLSSTGLTSVDWTDVTNKPTDVSYWTNDAGYITSAAIPTKTSDLTNDSGFITSSSLPTKTSDLTNDSGYITSSVNNLANYYTKTDTYTQNEVNALFSALSIPTKTSDLTNDGSDGTAAYLETDETAYKTASIPYGQCDNTSTSTAFTATVPGITVLRDGVCMWLKNGVVTSASGFTININNLGAKPVYSNMAAASRDTTLFNINYTMFFVYDSTRVTGGCWVLYRGYYSDSNSVGYQLRTNSSTLPAKETGYRYRLWLTSADGQNYVPINTATGTSTTSTKALNTDTPIDPFGTIVYNSTNATVNANANLPNGTQWTQYVLDMRYQKYPLTLTYPDPVYLQCTPQSTGGALINDIVQALPSTEDGKIYIYLGNAYSATNMELKQNHPVYYYKDGAVRLWTNDTASINSVAWGDITGTLSDQTDLNTALGAKANSADLAAVATSGSYADLSNKPTIPTKTSDLTNDSGFITSAAIPSNVSAFSNDAGYISSIPTASASTLGGIKVGSGLSISNGILSTQSTAPDWSDITNKPTFATVATSGSYNDLSNKPTIPAAQIQSDWTQADNTKLDYIKNKPTLATVATSGSYNDLSNKPTIPAAQVNSDWNAASGVAQILNKPTLATVATSGSYNDLTNKPTIPTVNNATLTIQKNSTNVATFTANASSNVTANISVPTTVAELSDSTDYATVQSLNGKQDELTAGDHINITNDVISATDYVHSDDPVSTTAVTPIVTGSMITNGTITAGKLATGATVQLTLSTTDIGEGAALAANTLYGVYQ